MTDKGIQLFEQDLKEAKRRIFGPPLLWPDQLVKQFFVTLEEGGGIGWEGQILSQSKDFKFFNVKIESVLGVLLLDAPLYARRRVLVAKALVEWKFFRSIADRDEFVAATWRGFDGLAELAGKSG